MDQQFAQKIMQKDQPRSFYGKFLFDPNFLLIIARKKKKKTRKKKKKNTRMNFNKSFELIKNNKMIISKISF